MLAALHFGRAPAPGEAESLILERLDTDFVSGTAYAVQRMANAYNVALKKLEPCMFKPFDQRRGAWTSSSATAHSPTSTGREDA